MALSFCLTPFMSANLQASNPERHFVELARSRKDLGYPFGVYKVDSSVSSCVFVRSIVDFLHFEFILSIFSPLAQSPFVFRVRWALSQ